MSLRDSVVAAQSIPNPFLAAYAESALVTVYDAAHDADKADVTAVRAARHFLKDDHGRWLPHDISGHRDRGV